MTVPAALTAETSLASAWPLDVSGRTAIALTRKLVPSAPVTDGAPAVTVASWSPLGRRYLAPTFAAICATFWSFVPVGWKLDQAAAGEGLPRLTRTTSAPSAPPATIARST